MRSRTGVGWRRIMDGSDDGGKPVAAKLTDCCNPLAKSDKERCDDCPMRSAPAVTNDVAPKALDKVASPPAEASAPVPPQPQRKQSTWVFLNGEIPRE